MRLTLAREELYVLLQIGKLPGIIGLNPYMPDEHGEALFNLALRTLIARGLLQMDSDGTFVIDETVLGILVACVSPDIVAIVSTHTPDDYYTTSFPIQLKPGLFISHEVNQGIHRFELYEKIHEIAEVAARALRFPREIDSASGTALRLHINTMAAAREAKVGGESAILEALRKDTNDSDMQIRVAHTMATANYNATFTLYRTTTEHHESIAVIGSDSDVFVVIPDSPASPEWNTVTPATTQDIRRRVHGACLTVL